MTPEILRSRSPFSSRGRPDPSVARARDCSWQLFHAGFVPDAIGDQVPCFHGLPHSAAASAKLRSLFLLFFQAPAHTLASFLCHVTINSCFFKYLRTLWKTAGCVYSPFPLGIRSGTSADSTWRALRSGRGLYLEPAQRKSMLCLQPAPKSDISRRIGRENQCVEQS
jgi:hypothetical protein